MQSDESRHHLVNMSGSQLFIRFVGSPHQFIACEIARFNNISSHSHIVSHAEKKSENESVIHNYKPCKHIIFTSKKKLCDM